MFLVDFFVFTARSIYFLLESLILTLTPNRYRKLKVSVANRIVDTHFDRQKKSKCDNNNKKKTTATLQCLS